MEPQATQPNLAEIIVEALKMKGFTLARLAEITDIPESVLATLLEEKYDKLPPAPYVHGYLLRVAEALGLDGGRLWAEYLKDRGEIKRPGARDLLPQNRFRTGRFRRKSWLIGAAIIIVFGYIILRLPGFFGTSSLDLQPLPATVTLPNLTVQGRVNPTDQLSLNGAAIYPDKSGDFKQEVTLQPGFNTLTFDVKKLMGQTYAVTRQVFYNAPSSTNLNIEVVSTTTSTDIKNPTSTKK